MTDFALSAEQRSLVRLPLHSRIFLEGPAGMGKTTAAGARLLGLIQSGVPAERILVLVPQRTLGVPYLYTVQQPDFPAGGATEVLTVSGLAQRLIALFWPEIAGPAGFAQPQLPPTFLSLETAQYYLYQLVQPLLEQGYFDTIAIDRNRLLGQLLSNLNKAAAVGFDHSSIGQRLKNAWVGEPAQMHVYDEAQECANRFRRFCLEHNLLDYSLQLEIFSRYLWPAEFCHSYLLDRYRHLIFDNVEEDVPVIHDMLHQWLLQLESALLIADSDGGYRVFLGADPESAATLQQACDSVVTFTQSWVTASALQALAEGLSASINHREIEPIAAQAPAFTFAYHRYVPEMIDWVTQQIGELVHQHSVPPREIAVLSPFMTDTLRFSLMHRLGQAEVPAFSHRPSRSLSAEPATQCLLTLARLAHPQWGLPCSRQDVRYALMQAIAGMGLVRADLLAQITFKESKIEAGLNSFDTIHPETGMQERITYHLGERFETLRQWLEAYRQSETLELDVFLSRLFGEVLSQPGFGFHQNFDAAAVAARLIESVQRFRRAVGDTLAGDPAPLGRTYLQMVEADILGVQYLQQQSAQAEDAVLLAPAYTFLMINQPVTHQFWLDIGSAGWWERIDQPLTHPYVLSRNWPETAVWTDPDNLATNQIAMTRLVRGLISRCREQVWMTSSGLNEQGSEQRGPLLLAVQRILRQAPGLGRISNV